MRSRVLLNLIIVGGLVATLVAGSGQLAIAASCQTSTNLETALHDEALAYAEYQAWAGQAASVGNTAAAELLATIANEERDDHFAQLAAAFRLVGLDTTNLRTAIVDERTEATTLYPGFAAQATAGGDPTAAALFSELAADEAEHQSTLTQVLRVLLIGGRWPALPAIDPVTIVEGPAQSTGQTLANLLAAMRGEAFASARYLAFSQFAFQHGRTTVGVFFLRLSGIELYEHFAQLANLAGLVGDTTANLTAALAAENGAIVSYDAWTAQATAVGDTEEADLFVDIRGDEVVHQAAFTAALGG